MDGDDQLLLNQTYLYQEKKMEEMKQSLVLAMELQQSRIKSRDEQILHLKQQLAAAIKDRDEAQQKCKKALVDMLLLQQQLKQSRQSSDPNSAISSMDGFSSDDCDGSIVSAPEFPFEIKVALPERGQFLEAVRNAGPLLESLLLAGPMPQWRHPPPAVDPYKIPAPALVVPPQDWWGRKRGVEVERHWSEEMNAPIKLKQRRQD